MHGSFGAGDSPSLARIINNVRPQNMHNDTSQEKGTVRTAAGYFALILSGSLLASVLGGGFGALIASVSPRFISGLFTLKPEDGSVVRYALSVGMIWGLFIGVAVSCFSCLLTTILKIIRLRIEHRNGDKNV
jgi:hypothetical protein